MGTHQAMGISITKWCPGGLGGLAPGDDCNATVLIWDLTSLEGQGLVHCPQSITHGDVSYVGM